MASTFAYVTPGVLRWARESTGWTVYEAASQVGLRWSQLEAAEEGADLLTLRQAEKVADAYERPLATFFLPEPPVEEPREAQFRRLPGAPELPWPPEMNLLARRIRDRQDAARELYDTLDEPPPWPEAAGAFRVANLPALPEIARDVLGVPQEEQEKWTDGYAALRAWVDAVEALGVLVMQDGTMPVPTLRGFASLDSEVPAIVVNSIDDPRARGFTVVHELGHLILDLNGLAPGATSEQWCNEFAGQILMPNSRLAEVFEQTRSSSLLGRVDEVARTFMVTPLAAAVRLRRAELVSSSAGNSLIEQIRERGEAAEPAKPGGGNYYRTEIARFGPTFIRLVFSALERQAVTYPTASGLLGNVKVNNFDKLRDHLDSRTGMA